MLDVDTFLTTLYVTVDDFCQTHTPKRKPGPHASLCASEVITLSLFARWSRFSSERDFYRYAQTNLTAHRYRSHRSHHGFLLLRRLHCRPTGGRDFLCCEGSTEPKAMSSSLVPGWPSLTCSDGDLITHTKR
jgi:hypothetical protein